MRDSIVLGKHQRPAPPAGNNRPVVAVCESLKKPHPIIQQLQEGLRRRKPDEYGMLTLPGDWHGSVLRVSPELRERALRILDALLKALAGTDTSSISTCQDPHRATITS